VHFLIALTARDGFRVLCIVKINPRVVGVDQLLVTNRVVGRVKP